MDDRGVLAGGPAQGRGQVNPQALARHVQDVQARLAGRRFEVIPRAPVDVEDVTPVVDDDTGRGIAIQEGLFEQDRELQLLGAAGRLTAADGDAPPAGAATAANRAGSAEAPTGSLRVKIFHFLSSAAKWSLRPLTLSEVPRKRTPPGLRA